MAIPPFRHLFIAKHGDSAQPPSILAFDPGETTGYCFFATDMQMKFQGQYHNDDAASHACGLEDLVKLWTPQIVVMEDYKVYSWKAKSHSWEALHTPRLIGAVQYICKKRGTPCEMQMAHTAKTFVTDEKLKTWGYWIKGQRHSRDSIRHALFYLLFGKWAEGLKQSEAL